MTAKKKILAMYHGERVNLLGQITHVLRARDGREFNYSGLKGYRFGGVYAVTLDGKIQTQAEPEDPGDWSPTEKDQLEWEAAKLAVTQKRVELRGAMALKKPNPRILEAVALLRPFYLSMKDSDRRRFMAWVAEECSKKKARRK